MPESLRQYFHKNNSGKDHILSKETNAARESSNLLTHYQILSTPKIKL